MVDVMKEGSLSKDVRDQETYRSFPGDEYQRILNAVKGVPQTVFNRRHGLDQYLAECLPDYEFETDTDSGRNTACQLWAPEFRHSVDLYNSEDRIAIEIEKSQQKRVSDDILKFIKGGKTQRDNRKKIEFGCLIVPTNYGSQNNNLYEEAMRCMRFMRSVLHVEDIAVIGYREP